MVTTHRGTVPRWCSEKPNWMHRCWSGSASQLTRRGYFAFHMLPGRAAISAYSAGGTGDRNVHGSAPEKVGRGRKSRYEVHTERHGVGTRAGRSRPTDHRRSRVLRAMCANRLSRGCQNRTPALTGTKFAASGDLTQFGSDAFEKGSDHLTHPILQAGVDSAGRGRRSGKGIDECLSACRFEGPPLFGRLAGVRRASGLPLITQPDGKSLQISKLPPIPLARLLLCEAGYGMLRTELPGARERLVGCVCM